jgi:glyoxylase I family protein
MEKNILKAMHHVAIICSDYEKSKYFYTQILGLKVLAENYREERDSYKLDLELPDRSQIELFSFSGCPARSSYPEALGLRHLAFVVDSIEDVCAHLHSFNIKVEGIRVDPFTGNKYTFFSDPDNLPLELVEQAEV